MMQCRGRVRASQCILESGSRGPQLGHLTLGESAHVGLTGMCMALPLGRRLDGRVGDRLEKMETAAGWSFKVIGMIRGG